MCLSFSWLQFSSHQLVKREIHCYGSVLQIRKWNFRKLLWTSLVHLLKPKLSGLRSYLLSFTLSAVHCGRLLLLAFDDLCSIRLSLTKCQSHAMFFPYNVCWFVLLIREELCSFGGSYHHQHLLYLIISLGQTRTRAITEPSIDNIKLRL